MMRGQKQQPPQTSAADATTGNGVIPVQQQGLSSQYENATHHIADVATVSELNNPSLY